jgi:hypothetical protein
MCTKDNKQTARAVAHYTFEFCCKTHSDHQRIILEMMRVKDYNQTMEISDGTREEKAGHECYFLLPFISPCDHHDMDDNDYDTCTEDDAHTMDHDELVLHLSQTRICQSALMKILDFGHDAWKTCHAHYCQAASAAVAAVAAAAPIINGDTSTNNGSMMMVIPPVPIIIDSMKPHGNTGKTNRSDVANVEYTKLFGTI